MKSLPYDSLADFAPAGFYGFIQFVLLVRADAGMDTLPDLIKRAKAKPRSPRAPARRRRASSRRRWPSALAPTSPTCPTSPRRRRWPISSRGQIDMTFADVAIAVPQVKAGKVKALVMASDSRSPLLPEVPTFQEAGLGQFALDAWFVIMAPSKTPPEIVGGSTRRCRKS